MTPTDCSREACKERPGKTARTSPARRAYGGRRTQAGGRRGQAREPGGRRNNNIPDGVQVHVLRGRPDQTLIRMGEDTDLVGAHHHSDDHHSDATSPKGSGALGAKHPNFHAKA